MAFKSPLLVPSNRRAGPLPKGLPIFNHHDVVETKVIGRGSFATVSVGKYKHEEVVLKEMHEIDDDDKDLLIKEARLLKELRNEHVVTFQGISLSPASVMLEYLYFSFEPFGRQHRVHSLHKFLREISGYNQGLS